MSRYLKVLKKIDKEMNAKGFTLFMVGDGEDTINAEDHTKTKLYDWATQCDLGSMHYQDNLGFKISYYLVYGNAIHETIADYGWNSDTSKVIADEVWNIVSSHFEKMHREYA
jgi:hypothetical protein